MPTRPVKLLPPPPVGRRQVATPAAPPPPPAAAAAGSAEGTARGASTGARGEGAEAEEEQPESREEPASSAEPAVKVEPTAAEEEAEATPAVKVEPEAAPGGQTEGAEPVAEAVAVAAPVLGLLAGHDPDNRPVVIEIVFRDKSKKVKHRASTQIADLLLMYKKRLCGPSTGDPVSLRVCDEAGIEQEGAVTLGDIQESLLKEDPDMDVAKPIRLRFEEDDWFN